MKHELKTWPEYFNPIFNGDKTFEVRKNDRKFQVGDELLLREYYPDNYYEVGVEGAYTGEEITVKITYILHGGRFGIEDGFVVLGIKPITK